MNKIILIGNVGNEPQLKKTAKTDICNFRVAVNDKFKKDAPPQWFTITTFGKTAEFSNKYIKKGTKVLVEGKIQMDEVADKEGVKRLFVSVIAENIELLSAKTEAQPAVANGLEESTGLPF
jgi:single-strand DNA-binding protein